MFRLNLLSLLIAATSLYGQSTDKVASRTTNTTFYAAGVSALPQTKPEPTGWAVIATEINTKNQIYSFSETDYTLSNGKLVSSARTGLATPLRSFGAFTLYGLGDAGVATTGTSTGSAFAGGGFVLIPIKKSGWDLLVGARVLKTMVGGSQAYMEVGIGRR